MRREAPPLLPIFRSRHQAELLTVPLHPDRAYSLTDLSHRLDVPLTTRRREARRMAEAELITVDRAGSTRLLRVKSGQPARAPASA